MRASGKNTLREILKTKSRFVSIMLICAIGVGFFSGVRAANGDMKVSADDYYDKNDLFDLRVLSTFGLTDDDVEAIENVSGADGVYASKFTDLELHRGENEYLTRVYSELPKGINDIEIYEGSAPKNEGECLISISDMTEGVQIGDIITLEDPSGAEEFPLKRKEYKIVGKYITPMFISITQRGSTNIGDGKIDAFLIVPENDFTHDVYTEIYITSEKLKEARSYSEEYEKEREKISDRLTDLGVERSEIRYSEVIDTAKEEIEKGEKELAKAKEEGQKKLDDAKSELDDGKQKIDEGEKQLEDGKKQLDEGEKKLEDAKKQLDEGKSELTKNKPALDEAKAKLDAAKAELDYGQAQLDLGKQQLDSSKKQLDDGQSELNSKKAELESGKLALQTAKTTLKTGRSSYELGMEQYKSGIESYNSSMEELKKDEEELKKIGAEQGTTSTAYLLRKIIVDGKRSSLEITKTTLDSTLTNLESMKTRLDESEKEIAENEKKIAEGEPQIEAAQAQIDDGRKQYEAGLKEYTENAGKIAEGRAQYQSGLEEYNKGLQEYNDGAAKVLEGQIEYDNGVKTLEEKKAEYEKGVEELEDAKAKYRDGLKEYNDGVYKFRQETADAEKKLSDARERISDAGMAEWYVFTRDDNAGYSEYNENAERIGRIAVVFPVFFLLVACLVCLTTMSRMVEEQRTQIGTLKALGYSNASIMKHYMTYAAAASLVGSAIGAAGGCFLFPGVIIYAYSMMYNITDIHYQLTFSNMAVSIGSMLAAIAATVFFSCNKALKETPSSLMRPKAPKAGKRIFLEKIRFVWNKMGFFAKVSARNLFRYKRRMIMTVVGISGCTALSLTGFGLKNSITDIAALQFIELNQYSGSVIYDEDIRLSEIESIYDSLLEYEPDTVYTRASSKQYDLEYKGNGVEVYIMAAEDADKFGELMLLRERVSGKELSITDGAVITEKAAKLLGASVGDEITVNSGDGITRKIRISGIAEHYTWHFLYMSEDQYKETFGTLPKYNTVYFNNGISRDTDVQDEFVEHMLKNDSVLTVLMNAASMSSINDTLSIMNLVTLVLILSAAALAFVVLYNLTNVNITERIREIATLKVLGFYDGEVSSYVFRENVILSLMGGVVGLGLGYALCMFVINTAELDEMMFGRSIHPLSFVMAFLVTALFSLAVNLIMTGQLKKVSMVESLKSVE